MDEGKCYWKWIDVVSVSQIGRAFVSQVIVVVAEVVATATTETSRNKEV